MVDVSHPLAWQAHLLIQEIERFPASDQQTRCVTMASALCAAIARSVEENAMLRDTLEEIMRMGLCSYDCDLAHAALSAAGPPRDQ